MPNDKLTIAAAQMSPVFLDRAATTAKIVHSIQKAADADANLVCFGETLLPAYPLWLSRLDGASFESNVQKELHALYLEQAVSIEAGHLTPICDAAKAKHIAVVLGIAERAADRGGHTIYCSCVYINEKGVVESVHRKLMPTYEERLSWGVGDGAGLVTHRLGAFTVGALNCWENWIPLARAALYAGGEDLHVAIWPGDQRLTQEITRFIAKESRSYVLSVGSLIRAEDIPAAVPFRDQMCEAGETIYDGGSCIAGPDGNWVVEPQSGSEQLFVAEIDHLQVRRERQNFDAAGHYFRPEVLRHTVDRRRHTAAKFLDD